MLGAEGRDAIFDVFRHLGADLEAQDQVVGEQRGERDEEAAEAAAYVCDRDRFDDQRLDDGAGSVRGGGDGLLGRRGCIMWRVEDESRVVRGPVHEGWACGAREGIMVLISSRQPMEVEVERKK